MLDLSVDKLTLMQLLHIPSDLNIPLLRIFPSFLPSIFQPTLDHKLRIHSCQNGQCGWEQEYENEI